MSPRWWARTARPSPSPTRRGGPARSACRSSPSPRRSPRPCPRPRRRPPSSTSHDPRAASRPGHFPRPGRRPACAGGILAPMARENIDLVRRGYEAFNRGDVEAWLGFLDPGVELDERYIAPDAAVYRGHDEVRRWLEKGIEALGESWFEPIRSVDHDDGVVTEVVVHVRGAASGAETTARLAHG